MAKGLSNTQRTLRLLRQQGHIVGTVERFNSFIGPHGIRQDLFGFLDLIAIRPDGIIGVQSCGQAFSEHDKKILENEIAPEWIKFAGIELIGWSKKKKKLDKGWSKAYYWTPKLKVYKQEDFN
jgi:hypothetical protein